jgi:long-subunit fatty acid transport protein
MQSTKKFLPVRPFKIIVIFLFALFIPCLCICTSSAQQVFQQVQVNSSFNPVGSGARAMGMGGAFIAVADDATAASWNPAGLIQLELPEVSMVGAYFNIREELESFSHPESSGMNEKRSYDLNYLSFAYPFKFLNRNMVASLNYQRLYDMYKSMNLHYTFAGTFTDGSPFELDQAVRYKQDGGVKALAPALAVQITPQLSLGMTLNIWTDELFWENGWSQRYYAKGKGNVRGVPIETKDSIYEKYSSFEGVNFNVGFLWDVNSVMTIGGVLKTPFTADMHHRYKYHTQQTYPTYGYTTEGKYGFSEDVELSMPMSYGLGFAFRLSDALTTSLDVYRTEWSKFFLEDGQGNDMSPITGIPRKDSHVHDTTQVRTGIEYLIVREKTVIPLRAGLFYDPQPSQEHPDDFFGFTLGTGIMIENVVIDWAYVFRYGANVRGDSFGSAGIKEDVTQHSALMSVIYHFQ